MNERVLAPIASHLAEWEVADVELAIYGTSDARRIAEAIEDFCRRGLKSAPAETLFYQSSVGAVVGLRLLDDRKVVIKAHQPDWEPQRLEEVARPSTRGLCEVRPRYCGVAGRTGCVSLGPWPVTRMTTGPSTARAKCGCPAGSVYTLPGGMVLSALVSNFVP